MKINKFALLLLASIINGCASVSVSTTTPTQLLTTSTFTPIPTDTRIPTLTPSHTPTETPTLTPGPSPTSIKVTSKNAVLVPDIGSSARSIVWSRDGKYLYIGTFDKGVAIYDVVHKKLFPLVGNNAEISALAMSPDGRTLAVGIANDGSIRLWAIENIYPESEVTIFPAHGDKVFGYDVLELAFSPDGKSLASSGYDGKVIIWDVETGDMIKKFDVWSTDTWEIQNTFKGDQTWDLSISTDGSKMISAGGGIHEANLWDIKTGKLLFKFDKETEGLAEAVSYDPNGKLVALGGGGGIVFLWDISTGNLIRELYIDNEFNGVSALAFNPNGTQIVSAGSQVIIWNLKVP